MSGIQKQNHHQQQQSNQQQQQQQPPQNFNNNNDASKRFVNDLISSNSKQLLNAYVYDFLIKSSLPQTASTFIKEADVPTDNNQNKASKTLQKKSFYPWQYQWMLHKGFFTSGGKYFGTCLTPELIVVVLKMPNITIIYN